MSSGSYEQGPSLEYLEDHLAKEEVHVDVWWPIITTLFQKKLVLYLAKMMLFKDNLWAFR